MLIYISQSRQSKFILANAKLLKNSWQKLLEYSSGARQHFGPCWLQLCLATQFQDIRRSVKDTHINQFPSIQALTAIKPIMCW